MVTAVVCGRGFTDIQTLLALTGGESIDCDTFDSVFGRIAVSSVSQQDFWVSQELQCAGRVSEAQDSAHQLVLLS